MGTRPPLVDTHCHIDLYPQPNNVVELAEQNRVYTLAVTNAPSVFLQTAQLVQSCKYVRPAVGLHPQLVTTHAHELVQLWPLLRVTKYVGEIGLDYQTSDEEERHLQRTVLGQILDECAKLGGKIVTLHSRRAADDVIRAAGQGFPGKAILHWFSGSIRSLDLAASYGMFFSVNPTMTASMSGRRLIASMPHDRVLTETDGPFTGKGRMRFVPTDVNRAIEAIADIWGQEPEETMHQVWTNFRVLLME